MLVVQGLNGPKQLGRGVPRAATHTHTALSHASRLSRAAGWLITPSCKDAPSADGATVRVLKRARLGAERHRGGLALVQAHELARDRVHLRAEALDLRVLGGELRRVCLVR